ncbi:MAG: MCP four helix bundle domain-containing protein [Verrucomicrobia bacterium]|nr:MCP four helix bundle domain-containing protein [Verrucomicrobiota bacterium]MCA0186692.1 methyl-accepting chemotaxis protein [Pseudomonadota bacterium]
MNTWTISRRIILGFSAVLLITAGLGVFALWHLNGLSEDLETLADNTLPSVLLINEAAALSRENISLAQQLTLTDSDEQRVRDGNQIAANRDRISELFRNYESLISDQEDRRLFEDAKQSRNKVAEIRDRLVEISRQGGSEANRKWVLETVVPAYEASIRSLQAIVEYNNRLGTAAGNEGKSSAKSSIRLIKIALVVALVVNGLLAWQVSRSTNQVLCDLAQNLDQGALQTAAAARQVSASSQTLSSGSSEQAASVEETSASLEEISTMIRTTSENAQKAKQLAGEARSVAVTGSQTMVEMTQAMAAIDASSAEVAKIVKNIDEIAFQTNILALNAAVEAARAGEAGAGFAVVADEVRSLAQRSAAAAKETADKIEAAIASSRNGSRSCTRVGESLGQIADKVSATDALVAEIATAAKEQAQGIEQINVAIAQMDKVTQSNSASAEESASAAEELDAQAESLKDMVGQLRHLVGASGLAGITASATAPSSRSHYTISQSPVKPAPRPRPSRNLQGSGRKAIPMPGDADAGTDDDNFRNF